jgi:hypothetical protein
MPSTLVFMDRLRRLAMVSAAALVLAPAGASAAPPGEVFTGDPQSVTETSARVPGYVKYVPPPTSCFFEYGLTLAYGSKVDVVCGGTTYGDLAPLLPGTLYHYRFAGANADGTTYGIDKTFTTKGSAPPPPPPDGNPVAPAVTARVLGGRSPAGVARRGLRVGVEIAGTCPCSTKATVTVSRTVARRLGIRAKARTLTLGARSGTFQAGTEKLTLRPKARFRRALRHARRVTATLRVRVTDTAGRSVTTERTVRLKR